MSALLCELTIVNEAPVTTPEDPGARSKSFVEIIPSPFDGINGFKHDLVKELHTAFSFFFVFLYLQRYFLDKLLYYMKLLH